MSDEILLDVSLSAKPRLLSPLCSMVEALAREYQFPSDQAQGLSAALGEAVKNAIWHGFEGQGGEVRVQVIDQGDRLHFKVMDKGLPFDPSLLEKTGRGGLGRRALHQYSDEVTVRSLGPDGMEVSLVKFLPPGREHAEEALNDPPKESGEVTYRPLFPADAVALTRCAYRTYGYSYAPEVYYPEMLAQGFEYDYLVSMGAFNQAGEMVGSLSILKEEPDSVVGELGLGMTDPRYRGRGIFEHLLGLVLEEARNRGMQGLFAETVTVHTITQKSKHKIGWRETGAVLAYIGHRDFKAVAGSTPEQRQSIILFYQNYSGGADSPIYLPPGHQAILEKILQVNGLERRLASPELLELPAEGQLDITLRAQDGTARISLTDWGQNSLAQVAAHLKDLCLNHVDLIMLDLPLHQPASALYCEDLEKLGFFFAGMVPGFNQGYDVLRLQYLNNVCIDPSAIQTYSDFARELLDYVLQRGGLLPSKEPGSRADTRSV